MTTLIIDGLNRDVLKKRSIVTLKWEDDPEKRSPIPSLARRAPVIAAAPAPFLENLNRTEQTRAFGVLDGGL
jgi:hypothetical protein